MTDGPGGPGATAPQVLIAGAGPAGLTAAHELARRGVRVRIIDKASGPAVTSRATANHARTLEICDQMGLLARLLPIGQQVVHFTLHQHGRRLISFDTNYSKLPTRYPFSLMIDQVITERVLRESLGELGTKVEWSTELESLEPRQDQVAVRLRHADGETEDVAVPWLLGADGAHSTVRKQLGLQLIGDSTQTWMNADAVLSVDLPRDSNHLIHTGSGTILLVPFPDPGKWRAVDTVDVDHTEDWEFVRARLGQKLSRALRRPVEVAPPTWVSVFTAQQRMIKDMRVGRCFVLGDAAHVHSPASGQGMNTGIQDAYNLAWKLADVVRGHADESLLDTYSVERVPVGAKLLGATRTATTLVALRNGLAPVLLPVGLGILNALKPVKRRVEGKIIRGFCGLALHYEQSPLTLPRREPGRDSGAGIQPGHRVACDVQAERTSPGWRALCEELTDPRWTLLACAGGPGQCTQIRALLDAVEKGYGEAISVRVVSPVLDDAVGPHPLADPDGGLRRGFGLRAGEYALIRPDGYLAAKGQISSTEGFPPLLRRFFLTPRAEACVDN